jgi:hypothetical protein
MLLKIKSSCKRETIEISIKDFGKCRPLNNDFFEITKLKKNKITSAFLL